MEESHEKDKSHSGGVKTARNSILYVGGQIAGSFSVLVLLLLLARLLHPAEFGLYAIVIAFYTLLGIGGQFGVGTALRKMLPEASNKAERAKLIINSYVIVMVVAIAIAIVGLIFSSAIATSIYHQPSIAGALQLASVLVIVWAFFNLTIATLVALDRVKEATIIDLLYSVMQPIAAVSLVLLGYGVFGALAGIAISIIIASVLGLAYLWKEIKGHIIRPAKETIKKLLDFSAPVATSNIALLGPANFAILLLGVYATSAIVGNYNAGYELGNFVGIIFTSVAFVLLPVFAGTLSKKETAKDIGRIYNSTIYYTLLFLLPVLAYAVSVAQPLMYLLFSSAYSMTPFYFAVIAVGTTISIIGVYAGTLIIGYGDTKKFMIYQLAIVAIELALLFLLTPILKGAGVLLALFVIGPIILDLIYIRALRRQFSFRHDFSKVAPLLLAAIITFAAMYAVTSLLHQSKISIIINLVLAVLIYVPLAALFRGISEKELGFLKQISDSYKIGFIAKYIFQYAQIFIQGGQKKG
jgi:O-antigen/teichoic acid export membrane protein